MAQRRSSVGGSNVLKSSGPISSTPSTSGKSSSSSSASAVATIPFLPPPPPKRHAEAKSWTYWVGGEVCKDIALKYDILHKLGSPGAYGYAVLAVRKRDKLNVAIKVCSCCPACACGLYMCPVLVGIIII